MKKIRLILPNWLWYGNCDIQTRFTLIRKSFDESKYGLMNINTKSVVCMDCDKEVIKKIINSLKFEV